jgi:hypothetical protein
MPRHRRSDWQVYSAAALRAIGPRSMAEGRRAMRQVARLWRRRSNPQPQDFRGLENPPRKKKRPSGGTWQPDLFGGRGIERREGLTRAEQLELAREEMRDVGARDLFDFEAEQRRRNPASPDTPARRFQRAVGHGERLSTARKAAANPGRATGRMAPNCPMCGALVRLPNPLPATVTCRGCGAVSQVRRP